jgi:hypothetical protein
MRHTHRYRPLSGIAAKEGGQKTEGRAEAQGRSTWLMFEKRWTEFEFFLLMATHDRDVMTSYMLPRRANLLPIVLTKSFLSLPLDCQERKCVNSGSASVRGRTFLTWTVEPGIGRTQAGRKCQCRLYRRCEERLQGILGGVGQRRAR